MQTANEGAVLIWLISERGATLVDGIICSADVEKWRGRRVALLTWQNISIFIVLQKNKYKVIKT